MSGDEQRDAGAGAEPELPAIDFVTFVLSLNHSALVHLGIAPDPGTGQLSKSLPLAKQTIDLLALMQEKTRGNLSGNEERTLENVLYELRLAFVAAASAK